jgi:dynein heavy chain
MHADLAAVFFQNTDSYKNSIFFGLHRLEEMVMKINDIVENRIHKNLRLITKTILVSLPNDRAMTLEEFVEMQEASVSSFSVLHGKSMSCHVMSCRCIAR